MNTLKRSHTTLVSGLLTFLLSCPCATTATLLHNRECKDRAIEASEQDGDHMCENQTSCTSTDMCSYTWYVVTGTGAQGQAASCRRCRPRNGWSCWMFTPSTVVDEYKQHGFCDFDYANPHLPQSRPFDISYLECICANTGGPVSGPTPVACNCNR